jgi:hypothetical protein
MAPVLSAAKHKYFDYHFLTRGKIAIRNIGVFNEASLASYRADESRIF